jgi:hypothetical protein
MTPEEFVQRIHDMSQQAVRQVTCRHVWSEPVRANNRFGRRSTSLYSTACDLCGKQEVRNGKARLIREVIEHAEAPRP